MNNVFSIPPTLPAGEEFFETLCAGADVRVERIVSHGQRTPDGGWLDQDMDEWVVLLQGEARLLFEGGAEKALRKGDWLFLPAHRKHRVEETSIAPPCVWLAIHGRLRPAGGTL